MANKLEVGFIPVRKAGKLPPSTVEKILKYKKNMEKMYWNCLN